MKLDFVTQPYAEDENLCLLLRRWLGSPDLDHLTAIAAWATFGGIARIETEINAFRARKGHCRSVVGVDEGGATEQGLRLAAELFDEAYVFYSGDGRTFHPKVYYLYGSSRAVAFVGSNNLTPGGTFFNFEAAVSVELDLTIEEDQRFLSQLDRYANGLIKDVAVCRDLRTDLVAILRDKKLGIRDEQQRRPGRGPDASEGSGAPDASGEGTTEPSVFGRSNRRMASPVPLPRVVPPATAVTAVPTPAAGPAAPPAGPATASSRTPAPAGVAATSTTLALAPPSGSSAPAVRRWFRDLDATAAQRPPSSGSNPTGNLRLSQSGHPGLDQKTYFRRVFFGPLPWASSKNARGVLEECQVPFDVTLNDVSLGIMTLRVSHADYRIASQNNVPTVLHWGQKLMAELAATSYVGRTVTLEYRADGTWALIIDLAASGPFIL